MNFRVGEIVECIDDAVRPQYGLAWSHDAPKKGEKYTVTSVYMHSKFQTPCVRLAEIRNSEWHGFGYAADRFRPLVEKKTDTGMAVLNKIRIEASVSSKENA